MEPERLIVALKGLSIETGSLACLGCEYEDKCSIKGCALIREAIARLQEKNPGEKNESGKDTDVPARFAGDNHVRRIDREKWGPCHVCGKWKILLYRGFRTAEEAMDLSGKSHPHTTGGVWFCPRCGRPRTPEAWKELERKVNKI